MVPVVTPVLLPVQAAALVAAPAEAAVPQKSSKPRVWTVFVTWFLALISGTIATIGAFFVVGVVIGATLAIQGAEPAAIQAQVQAAIQQPMLALLLTLVPFQLGMGAFVLLAARCSKQPLRQRLGLVPQSGRPAGKLTMVLAAGFTLSTAFATVIGMSLFMSGPSANAISNAILQDSLLAITLVSIILSLVPAVIEEVVFRGYIQRRLLERWSPKVAIALSTFLFAIIHADSLQHIIAVIPLGIVTGLLAYRTNSVKASIVVHALHNGGLVAGVTLIRLLSPVLGEETVGMLVIGGGLTMFLAGIPAVVSLLRKGGNVETDRNSFPPVLEAEFGQAA